LGERLYALRAQKGLTVERLAKQAGVDEMTIYNWASGRTQPKLLELGRVAKVLEIDIENLLNQGELTWGHEIRIQRIKLGYTQKETANMIGVTRSTLGDWERNQYRPSEKMRRRLKNVLSIKFE
jgi:transcriptional regulator with XRE-family HTH domain